MEDTEVDTVVQVKFNYLQTFNNVKNVLVRSGYGGYGGIGGGKNKL